MGMRITLGMVGSRYKSSLNNSMLNRDYYMNRLMTGLNINTASEGPITATKIYSLRSQMHRNDEYKTNVGEISSRLKTSESAVRAVNTVLQNVHTDIEAAENGTKQNFDRSVYAKSLREGALKEIVTDLNVSDGSQYLFNGAKYDTAPFTIGDDGDLYYRNINVNTGKTTPYADVNGTTIQFGKDNAKATNLSISIKQVKETDTNTITFNGNKIEISMKAGSTVEDLQAELRGQGTQTFHDASNEDFTVDFSKISVDGDAGNYINFSKSGITSDVSDQVDQKGLEALSKEAFYVDLGLGLTFDESSAINTQSVFNASQAGIDYIGFGTDAEGLPNNAYTLISQMADILEDDSLTQEEMFEKLDPLSDKLKDVTDKVLTKVTDFGSKEQLVEYLEGRVEDTDIDLKSLTQNVQNVDIADAAIDSTMATYLYNAALRIGTNILQPSILDFMK